MAGGCWICNPLCGRCQPAPKKSGGCPSCGTVTIFDKTDIIAGAPLLCKKCGKDLGEMVRPKTVRCASSGLLCAYPCGKSRTAHSQFGHQVCERNTPPTPAQAAEAERRIAREGVEASEQGPCA